jgi:hypothetical protein
VAKFPAPGALSRARALLIELAPSTFAIPFDDWASLASICDTGWLAAFRRPSHAAARVALRRLRVLTSRPVSAAFFAAMPSGNGPVHLRGTCAALPGQDAAAALWSVQASEDPEQGRLLIEEARDFLLVLDDGDGPKRVVYVMATGGHLVSTAPLRPGEQVSVFGFADEVPDRDGLAACAHGRGGLLPAIRSGSELPLLVTHVVR